MARAIPTAQWSATSVPSSWEVGASPPEGIWGSTTVSTIARVWLLAHVFIWPHHFLQHPLLTSKRPDRLAFLFSFNFCTFLGERDLGKRSWPLSHAISSHEKLGEASPVPLCPWHPSSPFSLYGSHRMRALHIPVRYQSSGGTELLRSHLPTGQC